MFNSLTGKGAETRRRILDTALRLFREQGFEATTMRDIARQSGMSLGAAYHYFPTKEALVMAYYIDVSEEHARRVASALPNVKSLAERLAVPFHTKLDIVQHDRPLLGALLRFTGQPTHPLSFLGKSSRAIQLHSMAVFGSSLDGQKLTEELRELAPLTLWAMHMGVLLFFLYDESPGQKRTRKLVDGMVGFFATGLKIGKLPGFRTLVRKGLVLLREFGLVPPADDVARAAAGLTLTMVAEVRT